MSLSSSFLARLEAEFPEYPLAVQRWCDPDDPSIEWFLNLLLVPLEELHAVSIRAWDVAIDEYGDELIPFHLTTVSPESSAKYFAKQLEADRRKRFSAEVGAQRKVRAMRPVQRLDLSSNWWRDPKTQVEQATPATFVSDSPIQTQTTVASILAQTVTLQQDELALLSIAASNYALAA